MRVTLPFPLSQHPVICIQRVRLPGGRHAIGVSISSPAFPPLGVCRAACFFRRPLRLNFLSPRTSCWQISNPNDSHNSLKLTILSFSTHCSSYKDLRRN